MRVRSKEVDRLTSGGEEGGMVGGAKGKRMDGSGKHRGRG
jgi:hypothetical protein